jgi:Uncharacterized conserved protein (COG2071)
MWLMFSALKCHPFPICAHFDRVVAISFALPADLLSALIPAGLRIDEYEGFGFLTVAMVWTRKMRPLGFPAILGRDFFLAGTRVFTRLHDERGRNLRGLSILRSETDSPAMVFLGNLMTKYHYRLIDVEFLEEREGTRVVSRLPDGTLTLDLQFDSEALNPALPKGSPFPDWRTARRFAGPMPFTFGSEGNGKFLVVEGSRAGWKPRPIEVKTWNVGIFSEPLLRGCRPVLANAFIVERVDYQWAKGKIIQAQ